MTRTATARRPKPVQRSARRITDSKTQAAKLTGTRFRTFRSALNYLDKLVNHEQGSSLAYDPRTFNLGRMERIMSALGDAHKDYRVCHLAGTKGKGSTATMLAEMLRGSGYRVGLYTSPHVLTVRERIALNGELISESDFTRMVAEVSRACQKARISKPTYFEVMTAAAFKFFSKEGVDVAVVETGLGGRLDSTNVVEPDVVGITSISFDHTQQLGSTLEQIAAEKAGIMKKGVPVFTIPQRASVRQVLESAAEKLDTRLRVAGEEDLECSFRFEASPELGPHTRLCLTTPTSRFEHIHVPLQGDHQALNCALALSMVDSLKAGGMQINEQMATQGLSKIRMTGRMELVCDNPRVLVDGAHNADSVEALMRAIGQNVPYDSMVVIFGCRRDKDVSGMLKHIQLGADKVIFTSTGSARSMSPVELGVRFGEISGKMAQVSDDLESALQIARAAVTRDDLICITGSFYLVGRAKRLFNSL